MEIGRPVGAEHYTVTALFANGESDPSNEVGIRIYDPASVAESLPARGMMLVVSPNPFGSAATVRYRSAKSGPLSVTVYDPAGARVRTLLDGGSDVAGGEGSVVWDGRDGSGRPVASGSYFIRIEQAGSSLNRRVTLLR